MECGKLVSIIITTHYRNEELAEALTSAFDQTYPYTQIIVVDDSGEMNAAGVVRNFDVDKAIYHNENKGAQLSRESGLHEADGTYIQFLDDDDRIVPSKIERQVKKLEKNDSAGVCYGGVIQPDGLRHLPQEDASGNVLSRALSFSLFPAITSSVLIETELVKSVIPFLDVPGFQDGWLFIELAQKTQFVFIDDIVTVRSENTEGITQSTGAIKGREVVLTEFQNLYIQQPDWVKEKAQADIYLRRAKYHMRNSVWSINAIYYFFMTLYTSPTNRGRYLKATVLSCFGSPAWRLGVWIAKRRHS